MNMMNNISTMMPLNNYNNAVNSIGQSQYPLTGFDVTAKPNITCKTGFDVPTRAKPENSKIKTNKMEEIDLDDIINDIHENEPDELDMKLAKIKKLHTKIITDKRRRRQEREYQS